MNPFQGITTEIISNGQVLKFYDNLDDAEAEETHSRCHYVEAVVGSPFQVKVNLTSQFQLYGMGPEHAVSIVLRIDGRDDISLVTYCNKRYLQQRFARRHSVDSLFTGPTKCCKDTRQWMKSDFSFGNLVLKETSDQDFSVDQALDLGKIQVTIQRVRRVKRGIPYFPSTTPIAAINEVPEKALKGRPIETALGFANARPASVPSVITMCNETIEGEAGKPVVFNIYYRSRRALKMMGIIPRNPSPEANGATTVPGDVTREVRDLRARLALLERGLNVKSESSSAAAAGFKRERDEESDEGSRQRVKIEHVDLTDDRPRRRTSVKVEHVDLTDDRPRRRTSVKVEHVDLTGD